MQDTSDLRSEGDACEEQGNTFEAACDCPIARDTIHRLIQEYICVPEDGDTAMKSHTVDSKDLLTVFRANPINYLKSTFEKHQGQDDILWEITTNDDEYDKGTGAVSPTPAFLFAVVMVLLFYATGRCITVMVPSHQMGIPGTALTLRRALRSLMDEPHYTVQNLLVDMIEVCDNMASILPP